MTTHLAVHHQLDWIEPTASQIVVKFSPGAFERRGCDDKCRPEIKKIKSR